MVLLESACRRDSVEPGIADVRVLLELLILTPLTVTSASIASWAVGSVNDVPLPPIRLPVTAKPFASPVLLLVSTRRYSPGADCTTEAVTPMLG